MNPSVPFLGAIRRTGTVIAAVGAAVLMSSALPAVSSADTLGPATGSSDAASFERSIDGITLVNGTLLRGDTVTVTNRIKRKIGWLVTEIKDVHPACMQAVPETSTWTVSGKTYTNNPNSEGTQKPKEVTSGPGWVQIKPGAGWEATPAVWTQDYVVTCAAGSINSGGLQWKTTWVGEKGNNKTDVGPVLTVLPGKPTIAATPSDAVVANDVQLTLRHPEGSPLDPVALTSNGKILDGCGNLQLDGNRTASCTWVPKKAGTYPLKAVFGGSNPATAEGSVYVSQAPSTGSLDMGSLGGGLGAGSLAGLFGSS